LHAAYVEGGFRTFSASASNSWLLVESRHPFGLETVVFAAVPQVGCEPEFTKCCAAASVGFEVSGARLLTHSDSRACLHLECE
jgi:hypothetical protein